MVILEELDDEPDSPPVTNGASVKQAELEAPPADEAPGLTKGFLAGAQREPLYGPEGSPEGHVAPETHKAHAEHKMNDDLNRGMNRGAKDNNGLERPPWYTAEWPKDCQYNSPGCSLGPMDSSAHSSELHKDMVRGNTRWEEALAPGVEAMRFAFMTLCDEDLALIIERLRGNQDVTELDLSHNRIEDGGVQNLVAALSAGAAPNLKELRIHSNNFGELGTIMLTKGLPVFRKKLDVFWEQPAWAKAAAAENRGS